MSKRRQKPRRVGETTQGNLSRRDCRFFSLSERESYLILWFLESRNLLDLGENLSLSWEILGVCNPPACVKVPLLVRVIIWLHCAE